ncbi:zinc finger domain-containing protein [Staphylococcus aureus]
MEHADGEKCERCWNYSEDLGAVDELTNRCRRCQEME